MPSREQEPLSDTFTTASILIPPASSVLDVGCNYGAFARHLTTQGCSVTGIEIDAGLAALAKDWCAKVVVGDIETLDLHAALTEETFDVIACLDVLEHLKDPVAALKKLTALLRPAGRLVISIPNITHAAMRLQLLRGSFERTEQGLLDRTHLQFFDRRGLERMLADAGMEVTDRLYVRRGIDETEIPLDLSTYPSEAVTAAMEGAEADVYQFVWSVVPVGSKVATLGAEALWFELELARAEVGRLRSELATDSPDQLARGSSLAELEWELTNTKRALAHRDEVATEARTALARTNKKLATVQKTLQTERQRFSYRVTQRAIKILRRVPPIWWALRLIFRARRR